MQALVSNVVIAGGIDIVTAVCIGMARYRISHISLVPSGCWFWQLGPGWWIFLGLTHDDGSSQCYYSGPRLTPLPVRS